MTVPYAYAAPGQRLKPASVAVGVVFAATVVLTAVGLAKAGPGLWGAFAQASFQSRGSLHAVASSVGRGLSESTLNPWYWAFVGGLTLAQWFFPARRDERALSVDMAVDAVWFVMGNALQFTVVAVTLGALTVAYAQVFGTWSLHLQRVVGFWGLAIGAFVVTDALAWVSHWCHHQVKTLWRFHSVHHSQQRLNALSDNRTHVGEVVAAAAIVFVPSQLLGLGASAAMGLAFVGIYYSAMLHSNIRTNLGPFKYLFMGPQAHRLHHSVLSQHFERNFGTVFPWWDLLAGTMYKGYDEYPPTGITDTAFPLRARHDRNPGRWLVIFVRQLVYPFQGIVVASVARIRGTAPAQAQAHAQARLEATRPPEAPDQELWRATASSTSDSGAVPSQNYRSPDWLPHRAWTVAVGTQAHGRRGFRCPGPAPSAGTGQVVPDDGPPAAWYDDPLGEGLRYWDGGTWTEHIARPTATASSVSSPGTPGPLPWHDSNRLAHHDVRNHRERGAGVPVTSGHTPPADWYEDPLGAGLRYWDGMSWTENVARAGAALRS
jgi:sterol desaturase/sphingolipid hydroxylase (fatty acid hydroxylase superfamily)